MTFFSKLFGKTHKLETAVLAPEIERSLFIDDSDPIAQSKAILQQSQSALEILLRRNFETEGYIDGFESHSISGMELKQKAIIAAFQEAMRREIDVIDKAREEIFPLLSDKVKQVMPDHYLRLSARFESHSLKKAELEAQRDLAESKEGICSEALCRYQIGYTQGFEAWSNEIHFKL